MGVNIECPYCKFDVALKARVPGKYAPICPQCALKFVFTVPSDNDLPILISPLKSQMELTRDEKKKQFKRVAKKVIHQRKEANTEGPGTAVGGPSISAPPEFDDSAEIINHNDDDNELDVTAPTELSRQALKDDVAPPSENDDDQLEATIPSGMRKNTVAENDDSGLDIGLDSSPPRPSAPEADDPDVTVPSGLRPRPAKEEPDAGGIDVDDELDATMPGPAKVDAKPAAASSGIDDELGATTPGPAKVDAKPASMSSGIDLDDSGIELDLTLPSEIKPKSSDEAPVTSNKGNDVDLDDSGIDLDLTVGSNIQPKAQSADDPDLTAVSGPGPGSEDFDPDSTSASELNGGARIDEARKRFKDAVAGPDDGLDVTQEIERDDDEDLSGVPSRLGGYEVTGLLGKGGMGAVYRARQVSLDRDVAVKVMHPQWAQDPQFVARFTREAYAAAQLVHHNVVQIYDIGAEGEVNYFSMEFVPGKTLKQLVKADGKLDPEAAAGYILQAARGLKYAHDRGMVHRDIKPDNLMLNVEGIVKVADLGLVKTPGLVEEQTQGGSRQRSRASENMSASITSASVAMGTPAYMAPEQAEDAAGVDHRADIYSLGCTFYVMLTGQPPFTGNTALEVMTAHQTQPIVAPDMIVKRVPKSLSNIVEKMVAKTPETRYQNIDTLIEALEEYLGLDSSKPFSPKEQHAQQLEESLELYNSAGTAKMRKMLTLGFFGLSVLMIALFAAFIPQPMVAGGFFGLILLTPLAYFIVNGIAKKTFFFAKARQLVFSSPPKDWLMGLLLVFVFVALVYAFNLLWVWLGFSIGAIVLALFMSFFIDRMVSKQRAAPIRDTRELLKMMRLYGLEEDKLRQFVCKYSGEQWEPFYEELFGYEDKLDAREKWGKGDSGRMRKKFHAWRDPIIEAIENRFKARQEAKERKHLWAIEKKAMMAAGEDEAVAARKAKMTANTLVDQAAVVRVEERQAAIDEAKGKKKDEKRKPRRLLVSDKELAEGEEDTAKQRREQQREKAAYAERGGLFGLFLGPTARLVVGLILLVACGLWLKQNGMVPGSENDRRQRELQRYDTNNDGEISDAERSRGRERDIEEFGRTFGNTYPLAIPFLPVPDFVMNGLFNSFNAGVAGLIFMSSIIFRRRRIIWIAWLAFAVIMLGPVALKFVGRQFGGLGPDLDCVWVGIIIAYVGLVWRR